MKITKNQIDNLNATISVVVKKEDYAENVKKVLKNYQKNATIKGFRKGAVPMAFIEKQYGRAIQADEINSLINKTLGDYFKEEKINYLGDPLPITENVDWDAEEITLEYELGLVPEFSFDFKPENGVRYFKIKVDEKVIDNQIDRIRNQFGSLQAQTEIDENSVVLISFFNEENNINKESSVKLTDFSQKTSSELKGKKVGDQLTISSQELFNDAHDLIRYLGISHDLAHDLKADITLTIQEVNRVILAELNQELFDKLFPQSEVTSQAGLREKISENIQGQYTQQSEQQFLNDVTDYLIESTKFDLPSAFLKKWLQTAAERRLTAEEAEKEYEKSEKGLRYQLIESKIVSENNLVIKMADIKDFAKNQINQQIQMYNLDRESINVDEIADQVLKNKEEQERIYQQLMASRLIEFYKSNIKISEKEVSYDDFIKEVYKTEE